MTRVDPRHEAGLCLGAWLDRAHSLRLREREHAEHMLDLRLGHEDHRGVTEPRVGTREDEQVGKARDRRAHVGLGAPLPRVGKRSPVSSDDQRREDRIGRAKSGREDQHVDLVRATVDGRDRVRSDPIQRRRDHRDVRLRESRVVVVREQETLAADAVRGSQRLAQLLVAHLPPEVLRHDRCHHSACCGMPERKQQQFVPRMQ